MTNFIEHIRTVKKINETDVNKFVSIFSYQKLKKNEILINSTKICDKVFYVEKVALRAYYIDENGIEKTRLISLENQFCSNWASFHNLSQNCEIIESLEESIVYYATHYDFYSVVNSSFELHKIYSLILEKFHTYQIKRFEFISNHCLQKRIEKIDIFFPKLKSRITNKVLASFLHTTPEHCSYLKKRISKLTSILFISQQELLELIS